MSVPTKRQVCFDAITLSLSSKQYVTALFFLSYLVVEVHTVKWC